MSQAGIISTTAGPVPPTVATTYVTDVNSPAVPAANILDVFGGNYELDNILGIQTDGSSGGNVLTIQLTNRLAGQVDTVDNATENLIVFPTVPPLSDGTYLLRFDISAFNHDDNGSGATFEVQGTITSNAGTITLNGTPTRIMVGDTTIFNVSLIDVQPGAGIISLRVTGVLGKLITWRGILTYVYSGV